MPYLAYLFCERCGKGSNLDIDFSGTIEAYQKEGRKSSFVNQKTIIWDYLIYLCYRCNEKYKYTYKDVEQRVREYFCSLSEKHAEYFQTLSEQQKLAEQQNANKSDPPQNTLDRVRTRYTHQEK